MCYQLHRFSKESHLGPWPYVFNFLGACMLIIFLLSYTFISIYGPDSINTDEGRKNALWFEPIALLFEIMLFIYFRKRIKKTALSVARHHDEENRPGPPKPEKKDLSYFR